MAGTSPTHKKAPRKTEAPTKKAPAKPATAKPATTKAPAAKAKPAAAKTAPGGQTKGPDPYKIIFHPVVTEKTMFNMDNNNTLEFLVATWASKPEIAKAIENLFTVKVAKVTTRITKDGKRAVVKFGEGHSAEDIGTRIGVF